MSNLTQFAPFAGGGLKSFQTGYASGGGSAGSVTATNEDNSFFDVTVSAITVAKAVTSFEGTCRANDSIGAGRQAYLAQYGANSGVVTTRMTSTTNLRLGASVFSGPYFAGRWKIAEAN
jgi:hypothetical protein